MVNGDHLTIGTEMGTDSAEGAVKVDVRFLQNQMVTLR